VPRLTGVREKPTVNDAKKMIPITRFGMPLMSIGFLVEEDTAMVWRGPMVMSAIRQMLWDVAWVSWMSLWWTCRRDRRCALTLAQQGPPGGGHRVHASGSCLDRCPAWHSHVRQGQCPHPGIIET
jgi:hypothetical protein